MTWVKFHDRLVEGAKRGIPRAYRFVYMELALKAAPLAGEVILPKGMPDVDAVHDVLGGDRKEVAAAIKEFTSGDEPMLSFADHPTGRVLVVSKWEEYNRIQTNSTDRVRKHRSKLKPSNDVTPNETRYMGVSETHGNVDVTESSSRETHPRARTRDLLSSPSLSSAEGVQGEASDSVAPEAKQADLESRAAGGQDVLGLFGQEATHWRTGISAGTGAPCSALGRWDARDLAVCLVGHFGSLRGQPEAMAAAIEISAKEYAATVRPGLPVNVKGYKSWLDAGSFKLRKPKSPAPPRPPPPSGPSMTPEETAAAARAAAAAVTGGPIGKP